MRMLIDECLPKRLKKWILSVQPAWEIFTSALSQSLLNLEHGRRIVISLSPDTITWKYAQLAEIVQEEDITKHIFR